MRKKLTLQEKYLAVASDIELSRGDFFSAEIEALITLARKGELHSVADIFYLEEDYKKNVRIKNKLNALHFYSNDFISGIMKLPVVQKTKKHYFENLPDNTNIGSVVSDLRIFSLIREGKKDEALAQIEEDRKKWTRVRDQKEYAFLEEMASKLTP